METEAKSDRRRVLSYLVKALIFATLVGLLLPFILSLSPSEKAAAIGQPILVTIDDLTLDHPISVEWRGHKNYVVARSKKEVESLNNRHPIGFIAFDIGPSYDRYLRSVRDDVFVVTAVCPHRTCEVELASAADFVARDFEYDGNRLFWDPCHGWLFDLAGRYLGVTEYRTNPGTSREPRIRDLPVPDYRYIDEHVIELGRQ